MWDLFKERPPFPNGCLKLARRQRDARAQGRSALSAAVLIASDALYFSVPYLGGAKHLAVTANQSDEVRVRVFAYVHTRAVSWV